MSAYDQFIPHKATDTGNNNLQNWDRTEFRDSGCFGPSLTHIPEKFGFPADSVLLDGLRERQKTAKNEGSAQAKEIRGLIDAGKFDDLATEIRKGFKNPNDDDPATTMGKLQKDLSKQLNLDVTLKGDGSITFKYEHPNTKDRPANVIELKAAKQEDGTYKIKASYNGKEIEAKEADKLLKEMILEAAKHKPEK